MTMGHLRALAVLALAVTAAPAAEPVLEARGGGRVVSSGTAAALAIRVATGRVILANPFLDGRQKAYEAFPAAALLDAMLGRGWREVPDGEVSFKALDGYEAHVAAARLADGGAWLALRDLDRAPAWERLGTRAVDPGPLFLVWDGGRNPDKGYAWPWQVASVEAARFEDKYPHLAPRAAGRDSAETRGFSLFRARCVKCHALDQEGGSMGPDLGAPRNVTDYLPEAHFKAYVRKPSSFRYTAMPDHEMLGPKDLDDLWRYLKLKAKEPKSGW